MVVLTKFIFIGQLFITNNCPHRCFDEKSRSKTFINTKGKRAAYFNEDLCKMTKNFKQATRKAVRRSLRGVAFIKKYCFPQRKYTTRLIFFKKMTYNFHSFNEAFIARLGIFNRIGNQLTFGVFPHNIPIMIQISFQNAVFGFDQRSEIQILPQRAV